MKRGHVPIRTCIGCLQRRPQHDLLRLVLDSGRLRPMDSAGRGYYLCRDEACLEKARKRKSIGRDLHRGLSDSEVTEIRRAISQEKGLDGAHSKCGISCDSSGGVAVA